MDKPKFSNIFLTSIIAFAISMLAGYFTYLAVTDVPFFRRDTENTVIPIDNILNEAVIPVDAAIPDFSRLDSGDYVPVLNEFFIVRENNGMIGVFRSLGNEEHFLYNIPRPITLLPEQDQELLRRGIVLHTHEELTMFEEDFGS